MLLSETLNRVAYGGAQIVVWRHGRPVDEDGVPWDEVTDNHGTW